VADFSAGRWSGDAVTLRQADDRAKVEGLGVGGLDQWVVVLKQVSDQGRDA
jgi:hypothetical protein